MRLAAASAGKRASNGTSIVFPDVCKTPPVTGPVPIPYPNTATTAIKSQQKVKIAGTSTSVRKSNFALSTGDAGGISKEISTREQMQLQASLSQVNARLQSLRTRDPNEWQKVLTEYAVLASALYRTLYPED